MGSFVKVCKKVNDGMLSAETVILGIITAFLVACIFIEVVCRYFFFISVPWAEELTRYLFIWLSYIGSAYAVYYGQHTEIDVLQQVFDKAKGRMKERGTVYLKYASIISTFVFQVIFAKIFWDYMMTIFSSSQTSPTMHIPMGWIYFPVFAGTIMAAVHCVYIFLAEMTKSEDRNREMEEKEEQAQNEKEQEVG
ncbi:MAG: TRAP transporter small permease [Clostridium sp.]|nr:TRAP transporter small permease [Clostridium sp.]